MFEQSTSFVIPAKAGTQTRNAALLPEGSRVWVPTFVGMTVGVGVVAHG